MTQAFDRIVVEVEVRDFGCAWGKKIVIGTPKNWASLYKSEMERL